MNKNIVKTIINQYDKFLNDPNVIESWSPLNPNIIDYHCRQLECLGLFLRNKPIAEWKILDFGCGEGRLIRDLIEFGANPELIKGVDIIQDFLAVAYHRLPLDIYVLYDGIILPFDDNTFDLVCQSTVFSSVPDVEFRRHLARELDRVLMHNGYLFWWDKIKTVDFAANDRLDPRDLFLWNSEIIPVRRKLLPGNSIRKLKGLGTIVGTIANLLTYYPVTHLAALLGPKPSFKIENNAT
jgi:SAM-dependent methyltransferase